MATLDWWVIAPQGQSQGSVLDPSVPAGIKVVSYPQGSSQDSTLLSLSAITVGGQPYVRFMGPFKTKAAALAAKPPSGIAAIGAIIGGAAGAGIAGASGNGALLPSFAAGGAAAGQAVGGVNWEAWLLRAGEVLLGIVLVGIALNALLNNPAGKIAAVTPVGKVL